MREHINSAQVRSDARIPLEYARQIVLISSLFDFCIGCDEDVDCSCNIGFRKEYDALLVYNY